LDGQRIPLNVEQRTGRQGEFPYWGANGIVDFIDEYIFDGPLVLIGEDGAPFFDKIKPVAFYVNDKIWVNNHIHVLRIRSDFDPRFVVHCLNATDYGPLIEGSTRDKLTQDKMGSIKLPVPSLSQQKIISDFLDRETVRIDALIAAKVRLLELLVEKRRALITRAVTHGIDSSVSFRETGVEWIPHIPKHWRDSRIRRLFRQTKQLCFPDLPILSVYREYGVIERMSRDDNSNRIPDDLEKYQLVEQGDLVINKMKAWQGSLGISEYRGITSPDYVVFRPTHTESPAFLHFFLRMQLLTSVYLSMSNGIRINQWRIEPERFVDLPVFLPPRDEQKQIVDYLVETTTRIDNLFKATERTIRLLKERRAALIAAAVTGQIDVGGDP
jgi:type I restriction enzyme S subunit